MIIKGQARGRARQLAAHLLRADENERIHLYECRGTLAKDVEGALIEMEARGLAARTQRPLYHASVSPEPDAPLKGDEIGRAVDHLETRLGLQSQPRIVVVHRKKAREHVHVVWSRIDAETGTSIPYSWNYRLHEQASRELEAMFGHRTVHGTHAVSDRPSRGRHRVKEYEQRQAARSGIPIAEVTDEITALWSTSSGGEEFRRKLEEAGYTLARGDRRVFVVIDRAGEVHALARRIDRVDTAALRRRLVTLDLDDLPSVAEARRRARPLRPRKALATRFRTASEEVTNHASQSRGGRSYRQRAIRVAGLAFAAITRTPDTVASEPIRVARWFGKRIAPIPHRATRASIVADYASKIAAARCHAPRDELEAILEALFIEREAALRALARGQPSRTLRNRKSLASHARPKRRRKPPRVRM